MSIKSKSAFSDYEMIKSYHTERRECEAAYEVQISTSITTAVRPDRVEIRMTAELVDPPRKDGKPLCSYQVEWPSMTVMSFSAALFRCSVGLTRLVQDSVADLWRDTLRAQQKG